jgi:peptidoglycan/xylan/chitin deacetylase (PgdA/CDA1 family)
VPLPHDEHRARRGLHNPTLAWEEARALLDYGFEIGSHGVSHRILTRLPAGEAATEIRRSKEELEARIGVPIRSFAYVKGELDSFDSNAIDAVRDAGYQVAFSTLPGAVRLDDPRWTLRRYNVEPFSLYSFCRMLEGDCDLIALKDSPAGLRAKRLLNRLLGTPSR